MSKMIAAAALAAFVGLAGTPALAQGTSPAPDVEPRNHLSPTDETEATPRVPPVTHPKPMERTRMGEPVESAPKSVAPPERATQAGTAPPRKATAQRVAPQRKATAPRRVVRAPREDDDTSLSTIFTQPRNDTRTPPSTLAPRAGPSRAMTYNYAPVSPPDFDGAPCPTRSRTSLGALFACTR